MCALFAVCFVDVAAFTSTQTDSPSEGTGHDPPLVLAGYQHMHLHLLPVHKAETQVRGRA